MPFAERGGEAGIIGFDRRLRVEGVVGDLDARVEPELSPEASGWRCRRAADRVTGAKYPSFISDGSDADGVGDITRGVPGTAFGGDMLGGLKAKGESGAGRIAPRNGRMILVSALSRANTPRYISGLPSKEMMGGL